MSKAWWSCGPSGSRADARLASSRAKYSSRPSFTVTMRAGEADVWTAMELCLNLWDHPDNPCRTADQLCGEGGCRVTAITTKFAPTPGGAKTRMCCLDRTLPLAWRCNPACQNGGACVAENRCDCSGTGFKGAACSEPAVPRPIALWTFDECAGRSTPDSSGGTDSHAWVGPGVSYERCGGADGAARGCAVKFSSASCCVTAEHSYWDCNGTDPSWCDDFDRGAVVTINDPPALSTGRPLPMSSALVFDGFKSLTVSAWVRLGIVQVSTVVGRVWEADQFVMSVGVGGTWDYSRAVAFQVCLDGCPSDTPCGFQCFHAVGEKVPLGAWAHLVGVFGGGSLRVYLDGRPSGAPLLLPAPYGAAGLSARGLAPIYAGGHPSWGILDGGSIDCLSFWGEELSAGQVRALHLESRETCGCPAKGATGP